MWIVVFQLIALASRYFGNYGEFSTMEEGYELKFNGWKPEVSEMTAPEPAGEEELFQDVDQV